MSSVIAPAPGPSLFVGYFNHSPAMRLSSGERIDAARIASMRERFTALCAVARPKGVAENHFRPAFATAFGHTDDLAFVLSHQIGDMAHLAAGSAELETFIVASPFSAKTLKEMPSAYRSPIEIFGPDWPASAPLVSVINIKMSWLLTLSSGLDGQNAAAGLIASKVQEMFDSLASQRCSPMHQTLFEGLDVDAAGFTLLDTVSSEDFLLVLVSNNYSLTGCVVAMLRNLTFRDLLKDNSSAAEEWLTSVERDGRLDDFVSGADFLQKLAAIQWRSKYSEERQTPIPEAIHGNHLLLSTHTTLAVNSEVSELSQPANRVSGFVRFNPQADINPGHEREVESTMRNIWADNFSKQTVTSSSELRLVVAGPHDVGLASVVEGTERDLDRADTSGNSCEIRCVPLRDVLSFIAELFSGSGQNISESGFQDINTSLEIPIPQFPAASDDEEQKADGLYQLLAQSRTEDHTHLNVLLLHEHISRAFANEFDLNTPATLEGILKKCGFGVSARGSAVRLFNEFATALADPKHMEQVIDITDTYYQFHRLASGLAARATSGEVDDFEPQEQGRQMLVDLLESLRQAFRLRVGATVSSRAVQFSDLRGSVAKLLAGGDAVLKCTTGFLRRCIFDDDKRFEEERESVNGILSHQINQRTRVTAVKNADLYLCVMQLDTAHVFAPAQLVRVVHELAHVHFEALVCDGVDGMKEYLRSLPLRSRERVRSPDDAFLNASEIFADAFVHVFVFGRDSDTFVAHQVDSFFKSRGEVLGGSGRNGVTNGGLLCSIIEMLHRVFVIVETVQTFVERESQNCPVIDREQHSSRFVDFAEKWIPDDISKVAKSNENLRGLCRGIASERLYEYATYESVIVRGVTEAIKTYGDGQFYSRGRGDERPARSDMRKVFLNMNGGCPIPLAVRDGAISECVAVFKVLKYYVIESLYREGETDGEYASRRMNAFIVTMKSLWHVSTRQRRRRVLRMLDRVNPSSDVQ